MENYPDRISPMTLAAAMALGSGGGDTPSAKVYYPAGSVPFLGLPALSENRIGAVYDVTDEFTSTEDFTDGGGKKYPAGTNVAIVNVGTEVSPVLKYDCMMGDLSEILSVIPSTASSFNKLATASDVAAKQNKITQSSLLTLTVAGWDSTTLQQTVAFTHDTTKRNVIDITLGEMTTWGECSVRAVSETAAGITFECDTVPETALTFKVTSMEVG